MSRSKNREKPLKSSVTYFERIISGHTAVESLKEVSENVYEIERTEGRPKITVLVADIYVVSEADIFEIVTTTYNLNCILLIGFYNRYSGDAKERAISENIGLFNMKEFFGAINYIGQKLVNYEPKKKITNSFPQPPEGVEVFLFGSILTSESINDVDLAVIYDKTVLGLKEAIELRHTLRTYIETISDFHSEIVLLSREENEEMEFIQNTRTEKIK